MKIILSFNDPYTPHAATVMASAIANTNEKLSFAVLHASLSDENQRVLTEFFCDKVESLTFHKIEPSLVSQVSGIKAAPHLLHVETYLRLFAAVILEDDVVVHIDCDTVIVGDVTRILDEWNSSKAVCACNEYDARYKEVMRPYLKRVHRGWSTWDEVEHDAYQKQKPLGMAGDFHYFNAGVMVMNLKKWRETDLSAAVLSFINEQPFLKAADQDALNAVLDGDFGVLHPKWNSHVLKCGMFTNYSDKQLEQGHRDPVIVHFTGCIKPWDYLSTHPYKSQYWKYRCLTPWHERKYKDKNLKNILKKYVTTPVTRVVSKLLGRKYTYQLKHFLR